MTTPQQIWREASEPRPRSPRRGPGRRGLSLVELMISLAITASLLTAVAAAFSATAAATEANDRFFRATQGGRVCLHQLLSEIRQCREVVVLSNRIDLRLPAGSVRLQDNEEYRTYKFDSVTNELWFYVYNSTNVELQKHRLAKNVKGLFMKETRKIKDPVTGVLTDTGIVNRVSVLLSVTVGTEKVDLSGSAVPRPALLN